MESSNSTHTEGLTAKVEPIVHVPSGSIADDMLTAVSPAVPWPAGMAFMDYVKQTGERINREQDGKCRTKEEQDLSRRSQRVSRAMEELFRQRGKRYENSRFDNYVAKTKAQQEVVDKLRAYAKDSQAKIQEGTNVILFGPRGTGKDHLLMSLARACAYQSGCCIRWANGVDLMEDFRRKAMDRPSSLDRFTLDDGIENCDVLWISDPLPPSGALSEFQQTALFQLIDARYSNLRPTWVSLNATSAKEAEERMGAQVVDRLRHGALRLLCNWGSYREEQ